MRIGMYSTQRFAAFERSKSELPCNSRWSNYGNAGNKLARVAMGRRYKCTISKQSTNLEAAGTLYRPFLNRIEAANSKSNKRVRDTSSPMVRAPLLYILSMGQSFSLFQMLAKGYGSVSSNVTM